MKSSNFMYTEHENNQYNIKNTVSILQEGRALTQTLKYSEHECRVTLDKRTERQTALTWQHLGKWFSAKSPMAETAK